MEDWVCHQAAELYSCAQRFKINGKRARSGKDAAHTLEQRTDSPEVAASIAGGVRGKWVSTIAAVVFGL